MAWSGFKRMDAHSIFSSRALCIGLYSSVSTPPQFEQILTTYPERSSLVVDTSIDTALEPRYTGAPTPSQIVEICVTPTSAPLSSRVLVDSGRTFPALERRRSVHQRDGQQEDGCSEETHWRQWKSGAEQGLQSNSTALKASTSCSGTSDTLW
ncbi:hypothetical protein BV25DRAFT_1468741 [Artomyces pyxidatus]|uniref:Uncharacterized protein n=1 Tax=Artomyces pyxidatus TaxID=48021 RepID=A0ACB8SLJ0_9AGAM|nr:hypothetical protein BV25DRAFT_1468741 [Artomyces pyxidatus]